MALRRFPAEFADLLSARGRRIASGRAPEVVADFKAARPHYISVSGIVDQAMARSCVALLDREHLPALTALRRRIPPETIWGMKKNYAEKLPKTVHQRTSYMEKSRELALARRTGLWQMLRSESFRALAQGLTGRRLADDWGCQLICYSPGDYVGPHNDHHPELPAVRDGYIDVHVMFATEAVAHQWLVHERNGYLSAIQSINLNGAASAYLLPFWHYTTPLVAKPGRQSQARRWLLLGTFEFA